MPVSITKSLTFINSPYEFLTGFNAQNTVLFIDENVYDHHAQVLAGFEQIIIPSGEEQKRFEVVEMLLETLLEAGIDRNGTIIGIGGGVVTDLTGFVASIYLRGVKFGFLPTTLLAMCDAAIGGKNGINFGSYKNMVGNINQPNFIAFYPEFLTTLPAREFNSGMAEVIKHAVINGGKLHHFLSRTSAEDLRTDLEKVTTLCKLASEVKVNVVEQDERESGLRKKLNLGHTIGHAIESTSAALGDHESASLDDRSGTINRGQLNHGECVAIGMVLACKIAIRKEKASVDLVNEVESLCNAYHLPTSCELNPELLLEKIVKDKKRNQDSIDFILPHGFGDVHICPMPIFELKDHLNFLANE